MNSKLQGTETLKNLLRTFAGESRARNKYCLYAEKAEKEGYEYLAYIFRETAKNEFAHARRVFNSLLHMNETTAENLKDAAMGEAAEAKEIYKNFEEVARKEGFEDIADFYKELREVEEAHNERFVELLERLESGMIFKNDTPMKWQCMNCGYIHFGKEAPLVCPLCKYPVSYFKPHCNVYCRGE